MSLLIIVVVGSAGFTAIGLLLVYIFTDLLPEQRSIALELLKKLGGEHYGLDLIKMSDGKLKRGIIYVALSQLEEDGLVSSRPFVNDKGEVRRRYRAT